MAHPGQHGRHGAPARSPDRSPGGLRASWEPTHPALPRPQHDVSGALNQVEGPHCAISYSERSLVPPAAASLMRDQRPKPKESSARSQFMRSVLDLRERAVLRRAIGQYTTIQYNTIQYHTIQCNTTTQFMRSVSDLGGRA